MIDTSRFGKRFTVKPGVRTFAGNFHGQRGTVLSEYDNGLGDQLVKVHVDGIGEAVLLARDIEIEREDREV